MTINDKISDYITFPRTFENYKWYKPILVFILTLIITIIIDGVILGVLLLVMGPEFVKSIFSGGHGTLNSAPVIFVADLLLIMLIPSLYLASKIIKDRPFSSYSSSRGGWNFKLYFKALVIPLILYIIFMGAESFITGPKGTPQLSIAFILVILITVPLQSIAEEYIFRGLLMQTLGSWFKIPILVLILQAIIFAFGHDYNSLGIFETLVTGLGYGFFAWKTNGIEVSSALHTANNFAVGLFIMLGLTVSGSSQLFETAAAVVFLIVLYIIMYYVGKKTDWFGEIPESSKNMIIQQE